MLPFEHSCPNSSKNNKPIVYDNSVEKKCNGEITLNDLIKQKIKPVYEFRIIHRGLLYDEYKDYEKNLPRPNDHMDRPIIWENTTGHYYLVFDETRLLLTNSNENIVGKFAGYTEWPVKYAWLRDKINDSPIENGAVAYEFDSWTVHYIIISPDNKKVELINYGSGRPLLHWKKGYLIKKN